MAAKKGSNKQIKLTLVRSPIGYEKSQKATVRALGLRRMNHSVVCQDSPTVRGMIKKIIHLVKIEEA
ncbi:MAG: 50S ribosomal protein L30 [Anaerolineales bacterium]|nr:50S ribosomal protein L30 [Anaerolineales bacterium]MCW5856422.1 50S ribosomal protein L30 [Anaerolineales bacterium]